MYSSMRCYRMRPTPVCYARVASNYTRALQKFWNRNFRTFLSASQKFWRIITAPRV